MKIDRLLIPFQWVAGKFLIQCVVLKINDTPALPVKYIRRGVVAVMMVVAVKQCKGAVVWGALRLAHMFILGLLTMCNASGGCTGRGGR